MRQHYGNPFAPIQILTGDTREGCNSRRGRLHDERRSFSPKLCIERRFESRSQDGVPRAFYVTFCTTQKVTSRFPCRELRGFPNLEAAHPNNTLPRTKLNPFKGSSEVLQTSNPHTQNNDFAQTQLNPWPLRGLSAALRRLLFPTFCTVQKVGQKTFPPYGGVPAGTAHSVCISTAGGGNV